MSIDILMWMWKSETFWMVAAFFFFFFIAKYFYKSLKKQKYIVSLKNTQEVEDHLSEMFGQAERINDYFAKAVMVYAFKGEDDARLAAFTAAKVAENIQRNSMVKYLSEMATDIQKGFPDRSAASPIAKRLLSLKEDIEQRDWSIEDIMEEKKRLFQANPEYLMALDQADPNVFSRKHPELFRD